MRQFGVAHEIYKNILLSPIYTCQCFNIVRITQLNFRGIRISLLTTVYLVICEVHNDPILNQ